MAIVHKASDTSLHHKNRLIVEILSRSSAKDWASARLEWELSNVYVVTVENGYECLCGHTPICEICVLHNRVNSNEAEVGNVCVKRFLGLNSDLIFAGLRRVYGDIGAALNADAIYYAHQRGWLNDWELSFSLDTSRKRKLSGRQLQKRTQINQKVLARTHRRVGAK